MDAVQIKFYNLLRKGLNLPDDKAAAFVFALGEVVESEIKNERFNTATKDGIYKIELKIEQSKGDLYKAMFGLLLYSCLLFLAVF